MPYATKDEVKSLFRDFADNSQAAVDDADLDLFIANTDAVIDAKIGTLYTLPITLTDNPQSFAILKQIQMFKVACIVDDILNDYAEADKKPMWCKKADYLLESLVPSKGSDCKQCEPTMILPDATYTGTDEERGVLSAKATTGTIFKKGQDNW